MGSKEHQPKRVFVSSVIDGFEDYREAARRGIREAGAEPVLVNEDFSASATSPRNACLDAVSSCDAFLVLVGARGGWIAPSGVTVCEEEYLWARKVKLPILAFIQGGVQRDDKAERFATLLSEYVDGHFRFVFSNVVNLQHGVQEAVHNLGTLGVRMNRDHLSALIDDPERLPNVVGLRVVIAPEREEEVFSPSDLESDEFLRKVYNIGHSLEVGLLDFSRGKRTHVRAGSLVILQTGERDSGKMAREARLELLENGTIIIDANVSQRRDLGDPTGSLESMVVAEEDIADVLEVAFHFAGALYDVVDKFKRHQRFLFNACVVGLDYRTIEKAPKPKSAYPMRMNRDEGPVVAHPEFRLLGREELTGQSQEIVRTGSCLRQKSGAR